VVGQDGVEILLHQPQHLAVGLGDDRRLAVDVEQDAERAEVVAGTHLTRHVLAVRAQPLTQAIARNNNNNNNNHFTALCPGLPG